ncbi:MAG: DUF309 domain-containing protein [Blastocatellia bacterium]
MAHSPEYLRGIELFNEGRYFECHEIWETIWMRAEGAEREFLHAMIQIAAALLHLRRGNEGGAASVHARARARLAALPPMMLDLDTRAFADAVKNHFDAARQPGGAAGRGPRIILQIRS